MAIPAEQGLVKQYTAALNGATTATVYFTDDGTNTATDLSPQLQDQGVAVFVDNQSGQAVTADIYATMSIYGTDYPVKIGSFDVASATDGGYEVGFGLLQEGLNVVLTAAAAGTGNATVCIVPANG